MALLTPAEKAFIASKYYAGKTAREDKGKLIFDPQRMTQASMHDVVRDVVIPFMKLSRSWKMIMDWRTVYHYQTIYKELRDSIIEPYSWEGASLWC